MSTVKNKLKEIAELITTERAFYLLIMITMISLPLCELLVEQHERNFEGQPIIVEAAGIMGAVMVITHLVIHKGIKYYLTDVLFALLIIWAGLSLANSENILASTRGYDYDEWLTHFMAYFSLMYAGTMVKDTKLRKNILKAFIFVLIIQGTLGILQSFGYEFTNCFFDGDKVTELNLSYGLTAHFNWYSALMTLATGCVMGICIFAESRKRSLIFFVLTVIGIYAMYATETRLTIVSLAVLILFFAVSLIVYYIKHRDKGFLRRSFLRWGAVTLTIVLLFAFFFLVLGKYKTKIEDTMSELGALSANSQSAVDAGSSEASDSTADAGDSSASADDSASDSSDSSQAYMGMIADDTDNGITWNTDTEFDKFASSRGHIWKYGLACVPSHWAFGVGLDNYRWCFTHAPDLNHHTWTQGKGHNELIHYLVTQGVFQLLTILVLWGYTFIVGIRNVMSSESKENRNITWILLGMFTAYIAQSMFNSSVVNIAPYYWITMGMILCKTGQRPFGYRKSLKENNRAEE